MSSSFLRSMPLFPASVASVLLRPACLGAAKCQEQIQFSVTVDLASHGVRIDFGTHRSCTHRSHNKSHTQIPGKRCLRTPPGQAWCVAAAARHLHLPGKGGMTWSTTRCSAICSGSSKKCLGLRADRGAAASTTRRSGGYGSRSAT